MKKGKNGVPFSEMMGPSTVDIWVVYFTRTLTTDTYMHICILTSDHYTVEPVLGGHSKKNDQLLLNAGQKYCRMLQGEHSAILSNYIKLQFVIKIFVLSFLSDCLRQVLLYCQSTCNLFCGVRRLPVR